MACAVLYDTKLHHFLRKRSGEAPLRGAGTYVGRQSLVNSPVVPDAHGRMRVSYRWLQELLDLPWTPEEVAEILTMLGLEVEAVDDWRGRYAGFVVGQVLEVESHPGRAALWVCRVAVGDESVRVVVGSRVHPGERVVVALPGVVLPRTGVRIQPRSIDGEESQAMLCSRWELGLGEEADRIWVLPADAPIGQALSAYVPQLEDVLYEVALTPNRGDCAGHLGIARELAAYGALPLHMPEGTPVASAPEPVELVVEAPEGCPLYSCRAVFGIVARPAPLWMQIRLWQLGMRPVLLPVDVMNYVMLELGQPLHAFDYATIAHHRIVVRWAHPGEDFSGLDGSRLVLQGDELLIADPDKPLALAGVLGGAESQVTEQTRAVLIESALFEPVSIRRTARRYGLETEAAYRFQRGVDPSGVVPALGRAASLLAALAGGQVSAVVVHGRVHNTRRVSLRYARAARVLGVEFSAHEIHTLVERLGFTLESQTPEACVLRVPSFRPDIAEEIDVIEEIARLSGYDRIPLPEVVTLPLAVPELPRELAPCGIAHSIIGALVEWGFQQVFTPVLMDPESAQLWEPQPVQLVNALGVEYSVLRPSLVPSLARVLSHNVRVGERTVRIFELGKVFRRRGEGRRLEDYEERVQLGILLSGAAAPLQWGVPYRESDFYDLRGIVEQLLARLRIPEPRWEPWQSQRPFPLLPAAVRLWIGDDQVGWLGQLRPRWLKKLEVEQPAFVAILELAVLERRVEPPAQYVPVPEYPAIRRDIAVVVDAAVPVPLLMELIRRTGGEWLEDVTLFDVFTAPAFGEGKRSLAFALRFRSRERTLREEEVTPVVERIVAELERQTGARLRR